MRMRLGLAALLMCSLPGGISAGPITIQALAFTGSPVPGLPGETFDAFDWYPRISADGYVSFSASDTETAQCLSTPSVDFCSGDALWSADKSGALRMVVREGDFAPAAGGASYVEHADGVPLPGGRVGFSGALKGPAVDDHNAIGFWLWDPSTGLVEHAREGALVPGTTDTRIEDPWFPTAVWSDAGEVAFSADLRGPAVTELTNHASFRAGDAGLALVLRGGDPDPGSPGAAFLTSSPIGFDSAGSLVLMTISTAPAPGAIYRVGAAAELELLLSEGDPAPGIPGATLDPGWVVLGSSDRLAFTAAVLPPATHNSSLWRAEDGAAPTLVAREGDALAGGLVLGPMDLPPTMDGAGRIAFSSTTSDASGPRHTILLADGDEREVVARVGAPVPGLLDATFADFFRGSQLNEGGDLAFWGRISEDGGPAQEAIFFRTVDGALEVVVQAGWTLDLAPGVSKTIAGVEVDFTKRFLSDDRRIAFHAEFTDGTSGILVAIVPEPSAALLLAAAALGLHVAREQRRAGRDG